MELDDLKNQWKSLDVDSAMQSPINQDELLKITRSSYLKNISRIFIPEVLLSCFYLFLLFFFVAFNNTFEDQVQKILSYLTIILLLVLPILSMTGIYRFYQTGKLMNSYSDTINSFKEQCRQFIKLQYLTSGLNVLLLLLCVYLMPKVYSEELSNTQMIYAFIILGFIALFLSRKIWKYYKKQIQRNEDLLQSLMEK